MAQLNIRLDDDLHKRFAAACDARHVSMNQQAILLLDAYSQSVESNQIRHADGSPCPVSAMISSLAEAATGQLLTVAVGADWMTGLQTKVVSVLRDAVAEARREATNQPKGKSR
jgi:predicted transcriptional regulator